MLFMWVCFRQKFGKNVEISQFLAVINVFFIWSLHFLHMIRRREDILKVVRPKNGHYWQVSESTLPVAGEVRLFLLDCRNLQLDLLLLRWKESSSNNNNNKV